MKKCELCNSIAKTYCESDQASLCWDCDTRVHSANFLVAKHLRTLLCHSCQSPTPWTASGPKLGPTTVSVCRACTHRSSSRADSNGDHQNSDRDHDVDDRDDDEDEDDQGGNEDDSDEDEDEDDENDNSSGDDDGDNQVVPYSSTNCSPPPLVSSSSSCEEYSSKRSSSSQRRYGGGSNSRIGVFSNPAEDNACNRFSFM